MNYLVNILAVIGGILVIGLVAGLIRELFHMFYESYIDYRIRRTNRYIGIYCDLIDRFISATYELSINKSLNEDQVKNMRETCKKIIDDYKKVS